MLRCRVTLALHKFICFTYTHMQIYFSPSRIFVEIFFTIRSAKWSEGKKHSAKDHMMSKSILHETSIKALKIMQAKLKKKLTQVENEIVERTKDAERLEEIPSVLERLENVDFSMLEIEGKKVDVSFKAKDVCSAYGRETFEFQLHSSDFKQRDPKHLLGVFSDDIFQVNMLPNVETFHTLSQFRRSVSLPVVYKLSDCRTVYKGICTIWERECI